MQPANLRHSPPPTPIVKAGNSINFEFDFSEFGEEPVLFGALDGGAIALVGGIASLIGFSLLGPLAGLAIAGSTVNDVLWALRHGDDDDDFAEELGEETELDGELQSVGGLRPPSIDVAVSPVSTVAGGEIGGNQTAVEAIQEEGSSVSGQPSLNDKAQLMGALDLECPVILQLIRCAPIRIVGEQRTGKTSLARILMMLRQVLLADHQAIAISPDHEDRGWPNGFDVIGFDGLGDRHGPGAIAQSWTELYQRCSGGGVATTSRSTLWDEFARIDEFVSPEELKKSIKTLLCAASKNGEHPIFICHGEQANFGLPGVEGFVTTFLARTVRIETIGEMQPDLADPLRIPKMQPTGKFKVEGLEGGVITSHLPDWLTEDYLKAWLPKIAPSCSSQHSGAGTFDQVPMAADVSRDLPGPAPAAPGTHVQGNAKDGQHHGGNSGTAHIYRNDLELLEASLDQPTAPESKGLSDRHIAVMEYFQRRQQPFTSRDIQRASIPGLKGLVAADINRILEELEDGDRLNQRGGIYWTSLK